MALNIVRLTPPLLFACALLLCGGAALAQAEPQAIGTVPPATPERLFASGFECNEAGYRDGEIPNDELVDAPNRIPNGWEVTYNGETPIVDSARIHYAGSCEGSAHVERIAGIDSVVIKARDLE